MPKNLPDFDPNIRKSRIFGENAENVRNFFDFLETCLIFCAQIEDIPEYPMLKRFKQLNFPA